MLRKHVKKWQTRRARNSTLSLDMNSGFRERALARPPEEIEPSKNSGKDEDVH
jgi:hypothetical protein